MSIDKDQLFNIQLILFTYYVIN